MFSIPRVNVVESDAGFSIEVLGRVGMRYREGDRSVLIDSEVLARKGISIASKSIRFWEPGRQQVSEEEKETIIHHIREALAFRNEFLEVH
ncbi:MAG TPA: hypothetical protein VMB03_02070 [Bryobacteraceae bacterium]|nr:hypothetical protein [Bryobacteraceae bacterium]